MSKLHKILINTLLLILTVAPLAYSHSFSYFTSSNQIEEIDLPDLQSARYHLGSQGHIAFANYSNELNRTGWAFIHIISNDVYEDKNQGYAAGYLEGYLTRDLINDAYKNFVESVLLGSHNLSDQAYDFINDQLSWMKKSCGHRVAENSSYWELTCALISQLEGMYDGYRAGMQKDGADNEALDFNHFYYLTNMGDLEDVVPALNNTETSNYQLKGRRPENMDCTAFVKIIDDDLVCAHTTFNIYALMLRVYKTYELNFQNEDLQANVVTFSARPGDLESKDDFYTTSSNFVVMETSFNTYNASNFDFLHYDSVPVWLRCQIANRLAQNASHWAQLFELHRSGTHNSQWVVVDTNQYNKQKSLPVDQLQNIVWLCEEYYYVLEKFDATQDFLVKRGYIAGYNVPYSESIFSISNYTLGYGFNYTNDPRAIIFDVHASFVHSIDDAKQLIRLNNNETGNPCSAISPRCDIGPLGYDFGAIDGKVTSHSMLLENKIWLISGPSANDILPPFSWKNYANLSHAGMPETFDFDWVLLESESARRDEDYVIITSMQ